MTLQQIKKRLLKEGYLITPDKEQEYCKQNGIHFIRLNNGAKIISTQRNVSDLYNTSVNYRVNSGAFFDPKGKEGLHHYLEHLFFSKDFWHAANDNQCNINASTYTTCTKFFLEGTFNPDYRDYSLAKFLKEGFKYFSNPKNLKNKKRFELEKQIILSEISRAEGDYDRKAWEAFNEITLDKNNLSLVNILGTQDSVMNINQKDIINVFEKNYNVKNKSIL